MCPHVEPSIMLSLPITTESLWAWKCLPIFKYIALSPAEGDSPNWRWPVVKFHLFSKCIVLFDVTLKYFEAVRNDSISQGNTVVVVTDFCVAHRSNVTSLFLDTINDPFNLIWPFKPGSVPAVGATQTVWELSKIRFSTPDQVPAHRCVIGLLILPTTTVFGVISRPFDSIVKCTWRWNVLPMVLPDRPTSCTIPVPSASSTTSTSICWPCS